MAVNKDVSKDKAFTYSNLFSVGWTEVIFRIPTMSQTKKVRKEREPELF